MAGTGHIGAEILRKAEAPPDLRPVLEEIQDAMGLPWLPFPWAAYARRPAILRLFWSRLGPLTANDLFLRESLAVAGRVHLEVSSWYRPAPGVRLPEIAAEPPSLARELDAFEFGGPQVLIQQLALSRILGGHAVGEEGRTMPRRPSQFRRPELEYPDWENLDPRIQSLVRQVRHAWSLPQPVPDVLALTKWPVFMQHGWEEIRAWRLRPEYRALRRKVAEMGEDALERLRPRASLEHGELAAAIGFPEEGHGAIDGLKDQVLSFTLILPGMIIDNALLRMAAAAWKGRVPGGKT